MKRFLIILLMAASFASCKQAAKPGDIADGEATEPVVMVKEGITLTEVVSPAFDQASLTLNAPADGSRLDSDSAAFDFGVANFELGSQTSDAAVKNCANSAEGQHIHLILNNGPYTAHYQSSFKQELEDGAYVGLAFLSRSYHESIKTAPAYKLFTFNVSSTGGDIPPATFDMEAPHIFYSRPKGTYNGGDAQKVLLDFYLVNTSLSPDGNKVRARINGTEFILDKWAPYSMEGLPDGETTIELTLLDAAGNPIVSPFNPVTRTVALAR